MGRLSRLPVRVRVTLAFAGVMAVVLSGGEVRAGDPIEVELPPEPRRPREPV